MSSIEHAALSVVHSARSDLLRSVLCVLESGTTLGPDVVFGYGESFARTDALRQRLRDVRNDLIELDVYRLLYGPLDVDAGTWEQYQPPTEAAP